MGYATQSTSPAVVFSIPIDNTDASLSQKPRSQSAGSAIRWSHKMTILLPCIAGLGVLLIIMGVIAAGMLVFGSKKVRSRGKNKLQIKTQLIEMTVDTGHVYFAIILGVLMAITPFPISRYFGEIGELKSRERTYRATGLREEGGHTIALREVWIDISERKEIGMLEYLESGASPSIWIEKRVIKDLKKGTTELNFRHATSGPIILPTFKPDGAKWRKIKVPERVIYNPFTELLRKNDFFKSLIEKEGAMNSYYMTVPVSHAIDEEIVYILKYYNAFQGRNFEWTGLIVDADTDILRAHITFPDSKPFKQYKTYVKRQLDAPKIELSSYEIEVPDNTRISWHIRDARKGEKYYIRWTW
jgi:hypothetical protein